MKKFTCFNEINGREFVCDSLDAAKSFFDGASFKGAKFDRITFDESSSDEIVVYGDFDQVDFKNLGRIVGTIAVDVEE